MQIPRLTRPVLLALAALIAAPGADALVPANPDPYQATILGLSANIKAGAAIAGAGGAGAGGAGPALYLDLNAPVTQVARYAALAPADRALLDAAKQAYNLHLALGGAATGRAALLQRAGGRIYVALDGEGGRWVDSPSAALGALVQRIGARAGGDVAKTGAGCGDDLDCRLFAQLYGVGAAGMPVQRGATLDIDIPGAGVAAGAVGPMVLAGAGIAVQSVGLPADGKLPVRVAIAPDAPLGDATLHVYNEGAAFGSAASYRLRVIGHQAELAGLTEAGASDMAASASSAVPDDHGASAGLASALDGAAAGRLETPGDADMFRVVLSAPGQIVLRSAGPTDVDAVLTDTNGATLAADADSGDWYNFRMSPTLSAGTYYVTVSHCCGGTGRYKILAESPPPAN